MRLLAWDRYVPDVEDNRARARRGDPAIVFTVRPPTARVWRRFWLAITASPKHGILPPHLEALALAQVQAGGGDLAALRRGLTVMLSTMEDDLAEILWLGCVSAVEWPQALWPDPASAPPTTGAEVWALRDRLDSFGLYTGVLDAIVNDATLDAGLYRFLASAPGPAPSVGSAPHGNAASVGASG